MYCFFFSFVFRTSFSLNCNIVLYRVLFILHSEHLFSSFLTEVLEEAFPEVRSVGARSLLQSRRENSPAPYAPVEFKERGSTCILLWAKNLTVSEYRSGKWERHNLSPKTFGEGVSPELEGSSCNATYSRWAPEEELKFVPYGVKSANTFVFTNVIKFQPYSETCACFVYRLVLSYENVLSYRSFKLM